MDRNQLIGITLIFLLLFLYLQFFAPNPQPKQVMKDTAAQSKTKTPDNQPASTPAVNAPQNDSLTREQYRKQYGDFAVAATGEDKDVVLENKDVKLTLTTQGGRIKEVLLKNYKTFDGKPLVLIDDQSSLFSFMLPTNTGNIDVTDLFFTVSGPAIQTVKEGDSARVTFRLSLSPNQFVEQTYSEGQWFPGRLRCEAEWTGQRKIPRPRLTGSKS